MNGIKAKINLTGQGSSRYVFEAIHSLLAGHLNCVCFSSSASTSVCIGMCLSAHVRVGLCLQKQINKNNKM